MKRKTKERDSSILGYEFMHMRCCAHILNLIVQNGLKYIHESITKVQNVMLYVRASPTRFEKFQECFDKESIKAKCLLTFNVPTRWNSTYFMLDYALKFVREFDRLEEEDGNYKLYFNKVYENGKIHLAILIRKMLIL